MKIDKTYIVHYEPLTERKEYLDKVLNDISDNYEYIISNKETDSEILKNIDEHYKYDEKILNRKIPVNELSVSVSHLKIYSDILEKNYNLCLVLEDDAIISDSFKTKITEILKENIEHYDFIFLSTCCGIKIEKQNQFNIQPSNISKCVSGYLVNRKNLYKVLIESKPISTNIDNHLNNIKNKLDLNFGSCEPPIIIQGSETNYKSNLR
jgi:GR25 family glycosyltransferase involved in LPS biosynthesis